MRAKLQGLKFSRLFVIKEYGKNKRNDVLWLCKCDCGNEVIQPTRKLKSGEVKSCGCYRNECVKNRKTTHGYTNTPTYRTWNAMINRCTNKKSQSYHNYGNRGITVCDRWLKSFENFLEDMGERPNGKTLDRIDNNGNYEPNNCRWSTRKTQQRNMRNVRMLFHNGVTKSLPDWCDIYNLDKAKVLNKFRYRNYEVSELINDKTLCKQKVKVSR